MNRDLLLMMISLLAWGVGDGMFYHFQPLYLARLGASPEAIGRVLGVAGALMTVVHLPVGRLVDRWGPHRLLVAGWMVGTIGGVFMAVARRLSVFVVGLWFYHLSLFVMVPLQAYLSLVRGRFSLARVLTLTSGAFNLGMVVGPWLGGRIAAHWGLPRVYAVAAGLFVLSTVLVSRTRPHVWHESSPSQPAVASSWRQALRELPWGVWAFVAWLGVMLLLVTVPQPLLPNFLNEKRGVPLPVIGELGTWYALGATAANFTLGALTARWGLTLALAGQALAAGLIWHGASLGAYRSAYFLFGGMRAARPLAHAQIQELTTPQQRGLTYGLVETVAGLALTIASLLAGWLYTRAPFVLFAAPAVALGGLPLGWWLARPRPSSGPRRERVSRS